MRRQALMALVVAIGVAPCAIAQEEKRPERMEGAIGPDGDPTSPSARVERPRLPGLSPDGLVVLHNQWSLSPAGAHIQLGDFPVNITIHPSGKFAAVLHSGHGTHEVITVDLKDRSIIARVTMPQSFYGICFSPDGSKLFASGGEFD